MSGTFLSPNNLKIHKTPHPALQPFINQYVYRYIMPPAGHDISKAMPLREVSSIDFFLGDHFATFDDATGWSVPFERCTIRGPRTFKKYSIRINNLFISFTVKFRPAGLYRLLGIPVSEFTNEAVPAAGIHPLFHELAQRLLYARNIRECIDIAEPYLIRLSRGHLSRRSSTNKAADYLVRHRGNISITKLADASNLSMRQFERNFSKEVGVSPKVYARMLRFKNMLEMRMRSTDAKWAAVACDAGYFDQMHLVREFKQFLDTTPSSFNPYHFAF